MTGSSPSAGSRLTALPRRVRRLGIDLVSQASGAVIVGVCAVVFAAAAVGGLSLISAVGWFGWIAYAIVLAVLGLALGPILAAGVELRRSGSATHREARAERLEAQRRKFGVGITPVDARSHRAPAVTRRSADPSAQAGRTAGSER